MNTLGDSCRHRHIPLSSTRDASELWLMTYAVLPVSLRNYRCEQSHLGNVCVAGIGCHNQAQSIAPTREAMMALLCVLVAFTGSVSSVEFTSSTYQKIAPKKPNVIVFLAGVCARTCVMRIFLHRNFSQCTFCFQIAFCTCAHSTGHCTHMHMYACTNNPL